MAVNYNDIIRTFIVQLFFYFRYDMNVVFFILCRSDTFAIFAFYWSFALDFTPNYFLAAWKSEESTGTPEKIKLYD